MSAFPSRLIQEQKLTILLAFILLPLFQVDAQEYFRTEKLKLALTVGNQVVMAYDEAEGLTSNTYNSLIKYQKIEKRLNEGDYFFYSGETNKAIKKYYAALDGMLPEDTDDSEAFFSVYKRSERKDIRFTYAEKLLKRAKDIKLDADGMLLMASAFNTIGIYYHHVGNVKVAEKLYLRALGIRGEYAGKTSEYYVASLHNLAVARISQGRYDAAEDILKYVINYYDKKKTSNSYQYAIAVTNQAMLDANLGRTEDALSLMEQFGDVTTSIDFSANALDPARIYANIGLLHEELGHYQESLQFLNRALMVFNQLGREQHPDYFTIKMYIAQVQLAMGNVATLGTFIDDALDEITDELESDNVAYTYVLETKAQFLFVAGRYQEAKILFEQIGEIREEKLGLIHKDYLKSLHDVATCNWMLGNITVAFQQYTTVIDFYLEVVQRNFYNMSQREKMQFWNQLKPQLDLFYSFTLHQSERIPEILPIAYNVRLKTKGLLLSRSNQVREAIYSQLDNKDVNILFTEWIAVKEDLSMYYGMSKETIEELGIDVALLESAANEMEKELNLIIAEQNMSVDLVQTDYKGVASALMVDEVAVEIIKINNSGPVLEQDMYCALILSQNETLKLVTLGNADELETKYLRYYKNAVKTQINDVFTYEKYWAPIEKELGDIRKVFISPDGPYYLINLNSLKDSKGVFLLDKYEFNFVPNTEMLTIIPGQKHNQEIVLVGNPTFNDDNIPPLPGTQKEVETIEALAAADQTRVLTGSIATEHAIKNIKNPKVLHIATHGFFLKDIPVKDSYVRSVNFTNPLNRSGLILAKPSQADKNKSAGEGVLTAYEAMNLQLQNTDLVVLSACETGTGEVINGEGVYGLTRSISIAGARNLIMSLWKVDDEATQQLMTMFYREWLETNELTKSFISAQKKLKDIYPEPYYWAAFVLVRNK